MSETYNKIRYKKSKEWARDYYSKNKRKILDYHKKHRLKNLDKYKAYEKKFRILHKERLSIEMRKYQNKKRLEILEFIGNTKCKKCGFDDWRALQIDHVNGNGKQESKIMKQYYAYFRHIKENIQNYQILCANCNWIKRYENKEHYQKYIKQI